MLLLAQLGLFGCAVYWAWHFVWVRGAWRLALRSQETMLKGLGLGFVGAWGTFFVCLLIDGNLFYPKYTLNLVILAALCEVAIRERRAEL